MLGSALDGKVASTGFGVDQVFLVNTLAYVLVPALMVAVSLVPNRIANALVRLLCPVTVIGSGLGGTWARTTSLGAPSKWRCSP